MDDACFFSLTGMTLEEVLFIFFLKEPFYSGDATWRREITEESLIHSLSGGDKLLWGWSLREVKKHGAGAGGAHTSHLGSTVNFRKRQKTPPKNGTAIISLQRDTQEIKQKDADNLQCVQPRRLFFDTQLQAPSKC